MTSYGTILSEPVDTRNITFVQPEPVAKCFFSYQIWKAHMLFFFLQAPREKRSFPRLCDFWRQFGNFAVVMFSKKTKENI